MTLANLTYYAVLLKNDLHQIHLHAVGPQFDKVHAITDELYTEAQEEVDSLAEMAIAEGNEVKSFTDIRSVVDESEWPTLEGDAWDMDLFVKDFAEIGTRYLDAIEDCECNDIHRAALDEVALFWDKEVNFFNAARQVGCENPDVEAEKEDSYDAMDDAEVAEEDPEFGLQSMTTDMIVSGYDPLDHKDEDNAGADLWTDIEDEAEASEESEEETPEEEEPEEESTKDEDEE